MTIRGGEYIYNWESTLVFDYVFYDCTTETEPKYPISYLILDATLGGPLSRTVTLPNTTGQKYEEYCKPYFFSWKPTATSDVSHFANVSVITNMLEDETWANPFLLKSIPPATLAAYDMIIPPTPYKAMSALLWVAYNPIISDTVGTSVTMSSCSNLDSGNFTLKKELMVQNKAAAVITVSPASDVALFLGN